MLILIGPPFSGSEDEYARLSAATGLLVYDLKTKIKPDGWGVVKALGDPAQAAELVGRLGQAGFRVAQVDQAVASDPDRMFVPIRSLELADSDLILHLSERSMSIPYRALVTVVRGEVQIGTFQRGRGVSGSSSSFRAVTPGIGDVEAFRESSSAGPVDAFAAADIHFATVLWAARIDARAFDFSILGAQAGAAEGLDRLTDLLADRAGIRVDRSSRVSSVASFTTGGPLRSRTPAPGAGPASRREVPERFDAYSRLIAEAERQTKARAAGRAPQIA